MGVLTLLYARLTAVAPTLVVTGPMGFLPSTAQVAETSLFLHLTPQAILGRAFSIFAPAISAARLVGIGLSGFLDSAVMSHFHARVPGVTLGPVDMISSVAGLSILIGDIYALASLRGIRLAQRLAGSVHDARSAL